jgi:hypothetical protein
MTLKQIFLRFCKKEKIYNSIVLSVNDTLNKNSKSLIKVPTSFDELFIAKVKYCGLRNVIPSLLGFPYGGLYFYVQYPRCKQIMRKWRYFIDNNILLNAQTLKIGDNISLSTFFGKNINIKIDRIINCIIVSGLTEDGMRIDCNVFNIKTVNGKPANINWIVKRNRKIYGDK